ncbi:MAG TPA: WYL domain-containing protein [Thermoanaerobaculia bacterium]|nr:WYL domain-containing protein [Thermoanaerobaculia bacterium]
MKRVERLFELVDALGGRRLSVQEIARRFDVSERTAYRDLADVGRQLAPVVREEGGYRLMKGSRLRPLNLSGDERQLLAALLALPATRRLAPLAGRLASLAAKLEAAAGRPEGDSSADEGAGPRLADADRTGPVPAAVVHALEIAIDRRLPVRLRYRSLSAATARWRGADPWALFHRAGAWYLVGRCHQRDAPRTFRLDRVRAVEGLEADGTAQPFTRPPGFSVEAYLADAWDIYRGEGRHEVVVRFAPEAAPIVLYARHHPGETVEEPADGSALYRVTVSHLDEVARWVVGFGGQAVALEPAELVARVREMAAGALEGHLTEIDRGRP